MYDEVTFALHEDDLVRVLHGRRVRGDECPQGQEFTAARLIDVVGRLRDQPPARVVEGIFSAVQAWRGDTPPNDDMTAVGASGFTA